MTAIANKIFEQQVLPLFERHRADWLKDAREAARQLGQQQAEVTIDDVRAVCPPPRDADPRVLGAVFLRKEWRRVRHQPSVRAECHHRLVAVFALKRKG